MINNYSVYGFNCVSTLSRVLVLLHGVEHIVAILSLVLVPEIDDRQHC